MPTGFINRSIEDNHFVIYTPRIELPNAAAAILFLRSTG